MLNLRELKRLARVYGNSPINSKTLWRSDNQEGIWIQGQPSACGLIFRDVGWYVEISRLGRVFGMARFSEVVEIFGRYQ